MTLNPFTSELLSKHGMRHGFFSREGGVSEGIYTSLNCGRGSKDHPPHVEENRCRVAAHFGVEASALIGPRQCHSNTVITAGEPWTKDNAPDGDAIVTATPGLLLSVLTADCTPVLLADPNARVAGAVHAGWKGAKAGVVEAALTAMEALGARRENILAAIGPTISKEAYEVGPEFEDAFLARNSTHVIYFSRSGPQARAHFDLPRFVKDTLTACGVTNCQDLGLCTYKNESILFSHRRSVHQKQPDYGRQIAAIAV